MNAPEYPAKSGLRWPDPELTRVPYRVFTDAEVYAREQERIFRGPTWSYLALAAELPNAGDFVSTFVGDTPVVVTRDAAGAIHAWVNRCAHRGALVCRELRGSVGPQGMHTCVYHQWAYDPAGNLVGVPFRKGLGGKGGYPADFDMADHGLTKLRVETVGGLVFGTLSATAPGLAEYPNCPIDGPALGVVHGRDDAHRLVQRDGDDRRVELDAHAVHVDDRRERVHAHAELEHLVAVDRHATGRDEVLARAPRAQARRREHLLQAHAVGVVDVDRHLGGAARACVGRLDAPSLRGPPGAAAARVPAPALGTRSTAARRRHPGRRARPRRSHRASRHRDEAATARRTAAGARRRCATPPR